MASTWTARLDSPISFTDPDTGEKGIKNQYYRTLGCIRSFRAPPPAHPTLAQAQWDVLRDEMPAWLIEISGMTDPMNSDNVTVTISRGVDHVSRDATGAVRSDMSFKVDPDPRTHNVLHGSIKDGVLTTERGAISVIVADPFLIPEFNWKQARLKLKMKPDGSLKRHPGRLSRLVCALLELRRIRLGRGAQRFGRHAGLCITRLKRNADAYPDATGQNQSTFRRRMRLRRFRRSCCTPTTRTTRRSPTRAALFRRDGSRRIWAALVEEVGMVMLISLHRRGALSARVGFAAAAALAGCGQQDDAPVDQGRPGFTCGGSRSRSTGRSSPMSSARRSRCRAGSSLTFATTG
jgi:hypothetical protein